MKLSPARKTDLICIAVFVAAMLIFFYDPLFTGRAYFLDDIEKYYVPCHYFKMDMARAGKLHMWNPYMFSGTPYLADPQAAVFYPPNWLFFFVQPDRGIVWFVFIHFLAAGLCAYLFLRTLDLENVSALCGAFFYALSGFAVLHVIHLNLLAAFSLLPLGLFVTHRLIEHNNLKWTALTALFFGLHILAGSYQVTLILVIIMAAYFIGHLDFKNFFSPNQLKMIGLFIFALFVGALIAAMQLAPSFNFIANSTRAGALSFKNATSGSISPGQLFMTIVPDYFGHPIKGPGYTGGFKYWEVCFYIGIFPVLLALAGPLICPASEKGNVRIFLVLVVLGVVLGMGKYTPVYRWIYSVPLFTRLRAPGRFMALTLIPLSYFTALGVEHLPGIYKKIEKPAAGYLTLALSSMGLMVAVLTIHFAGTGIKGMRAGFTWFLTTAVVGMGIMLLTATGNMSGPKFRIAAFILLIISAFSFGFTWNPTLKQGYFKKILKPFDKFAGRTPPVRVQYAPAYSTSRTVNLPSVKKVSNSMGYNPLALRHYMEYLVFNDSGVLPDEKTLQKLAMMGNHYGVKNTKTPTARLLNLKLDLRSKAFENGVTFSAKRLKNPYPRVMLAEKTRVIKNKKKMLKLLRSGKVNPLKTACFLEKPAVPAYELNEEDKGEAGKSKPPKITGFTPDAVRVQVDPKKPSWLVLNEIYHPQWRANVDGDKFRIVHRVNYTFRAVRVYPGEKEVVFYFNPAPVKLGAMATAAGLVTVVILLIVYYIRQLRKRRL